MYSPAATISASIISAQPRIMLVGSLSTLPRASSMAYCAGVTMAPWRTMTSPVTQTTSSTSSRARSRLISVVSSSMSMLGLSRARTASTATPTSSGS